MDFVAQVLVLLHLVGFAALLGGVLVQTRAPEPEVSMTMVLGAWLELLTGLVLVALAVLDDRPVDVAPLVVKVLLTLVLVLLVGKNRKFSSIPRGLWALIGLLALVNAAVSVFWR